MIKEYLKHAVQIETLVLEQKQVVSYLQRTINELNHYSYEKKQNIYSMTDILALALPIGLITGLRLDFCHMFLALKICLIYQ